MTGSAAAGQIRRAGPRDRVTVGAVLAAAFYDGDLAPWLVPDPDERARVYPRYFDLISEHALEHGLVDIVEDLAVAVWYEHSVRGGPPPIDDQARLAAAVGSNRDRFEALDDAMHRHHPVGETHHYLAFLAVRPVSQGQGYGRLLLRHGKDRLDGAGMPSFLEATSAHLRPFYCRHGYVSRSTYRPAATCPRLYPMWREPSPGIDVNNG